MGYSPRNLRLPRPSEMRERFRPEGTSGALLLGWVASALLAVAVPASKWASERSRYYGYYGKYNQYQNQQRQYEEQANGNYNGYNGAGGYSRLCRWWDFSCRYKMGRYQQMYGNGNGDGGGEQAQMRSMIPGWYFFFGGSVEGDEREGEEMGMGQNEGPMKFVYIATLVMFVGLVVFGFRSMYAGKDRMGVIFALLIFGTFCLLNLLTTVQGTVETDNRFFENSVYGWFGQWSVLVAYTDFWIMLHCFIFAALLGMMRCLDKKAARAATLEQTAAPAEASAAHYNLEGGGYKPQISAAERADAAVSAATYKLESGGYAPQTSAAEAAAARGRLSAYAAEEQQRQKWWWARS